MKIYGNSKIVFLDVNKVNIDNTLYVLMAINPVVLFITGDCL